MPYLVIVEAILIQKLNTRSLEREFRIQNPKRCREEEEVIRVGYVPTKKINEHTLEKKPKPLLKLRLREQASEWALPFT